MIATGIALAGGGVVLLRLGWQRSGIPVAAGWMAIVAALALLAVAGGTWGLAVAGSSSVCAALLLLAATAATAPAGRVAAERAVAPAAPPRLRADDVGRRLAVFLLVVPAGLVLSAAIGWTAQRAAVAGGWGAADATALALFLMPLAWGGLAGWQMTRDGPVAMARGALALALVAGLIYLAGS